MRTSFEAVFSNPALVSLLNSMGEGIVVASKDQKLLYINPAAEKILGRHFGELQGNSIHDCHKCPWKVEDVLRKSTINEPFRAEIPVDDRRLSITATPISDGDDHTVGSMMLISDTTTRYLMEQTIKKQNLELTERQEKLDFQMDLARQIQKSLMPKDETIVPGMKIRFWNRQSQIVGGDFALIKTSGTKTWIILGDIMGKGLSASQFVPLMDSYFNDEFSGVDSPAELLVKINNRLFRFIDGRFTIFATIFAGLYDASAKTIISASAGHEPPVLFRNNTFHPMSDFADISGNSHRPKGLPAGLEENCSFDESRVLLERNDHMLIFSDGLSEAISHPGQEGSDPIHFFSKISVNSLDIFDEIVRYLNQYETLRENTFADDQTLIDLSPEI